MSETKQLEMQAQAGEWAENVLNSEAFSRVFQAYLAKLVMDDSKLTSSDAQALVISRAKREACMEFPAFVRSVYEEGKIARETLQKETPELVDASGNRLV